MATQTKSQMGHREYKGNDAEFLAACHRAGPTSGNRVPTHRQYRRRVQGRGTAFAHRS
jgi:hypothetical protein